MNIEKEREVFSNWHESEYGEHVTWWDGVPASHIHNDRWCGWKAAKVQAMPEDCILIPKSPIKEITLWLLCQKDIGDNLSQAEYFYAELVEKFVEAKTGVERN